MRSKYLLSILALCAVSTHALKLTWDPRSGAPSSTEDKVIDTLVKRFRFPAPVRYVRLAFPVEDEPATGILVKHTDQVDKDKGSQPAANIVERAETHQLNAASVQNAPIVASVWNIANESIPEDWMCIKLTNKNPAHHTDKSDYACLPQTELVEIYNQSLHKDRKYFGLIAAVCIVSVLLVGAILFGVGMVCWTDARRARMERNNPKVISAPYDFKHLASGAADAEKGSMNTGSAVSTEISQAEPAQEEARKPAAKSAFFWRPWS